MTKSTNTTDATPQLRPFTNNDWNCYQGCSGDAPEIAEHAWGEVVLDDRSVCAVLYDGGLGEHETWSTEFPTEAAARLIALAITRPEHCGKLLGESIGAC